METTSISPEAQNKFEPKYNRHAFELRCGREGAAKVGRQSSHVYLQLCLVTTSMAITEGKSHWHYVPRFISNNSLKLEQINLQAFHFEMKLQMK